MKIIAITGGIGSGKSVVARMLRAMGHDVYDTDVRARQLMDSSAAVKQAIADDISAEAILPGGRIDRASLAAVVFADAAALSRLNALVHGVVIEDLRSCCEAAAAAGNEVMFVETALLYESGLDAMVDKVWEVVAPATLRIDRVLQRNPGMTADDIKSRIAAQNRTEVALPHPCVCTIVNDGLEPVLPRLLELLSKV